MGRSTSWMVLSCCFLLAVHAVNEDDVGPISLLGGEKLTTQHTAEGLAFLLLAPAHSEIHTTGVVVTASIGEAAAAGPMDEFLAAASQLKEEAETKKADFVKKEKEEREQKHEQNEINRKKAVDVLICRSPTID